MGIKEKALQNVVSVLDGIGAAYNIKFNGEIFASRSKAVSGQKRYSLASYQYQEKIKAMKVGDIVAFKSPTREEMISLGSAIASFGAATHGVGSCITCRNKDQPVVEILRCK